MAARPTPARPVRRRDRIAVVVLPSVITTGLAIAWAAIFARTGGDLGTTVGSRFTAPAWFALAVVSLMLLIAIVATVNCVRLYLGWRREARDAEAPAIR